ncbi:MAG: hypothetical protein A2725_00335 [Candidatus Magasanikbacteria bacterium RIFCSPHIGHO2_01_FULL_33_34]|uniref:Thioredoxin domain-containing protein n=1 Tax=Candidatus Magasanikbacteria bacterium RIFCSPHIGHO2_01_FULL_33_34 TaxID=1798671 RepID=A0A1F6LLB4_9BACT|nr:MAG: hypothetical protein A2725_00335 [Candidatus Magasanikbacteria bacterium RIFCSPHIGHO2_01_FULL_33_34]OGH65808.1 MAG: hypothetical protein A3B83_03005 [Candidatus Magasanikbacteria bacterium RIFCSPHIGHO2_02_FULL_33_17]OGH75173.1 MAG: hypothetical protein A3A89_03600 [Candidatus Magasanikbacteria bacterium RIFCSPLOWO2_01_FULL_33_34]OGH81294.1 MAG: hypothetical protein A3F93_01540 [Candidatus Magasanikbacteria bacterium RIFCSPLOWO2_12_FULL_34_7]
MENNTNKGNPMSNMSQTKTFAFGLLAGVLVLCTIGFFVMLGIFLKGGNLGSGLDKTDNLAVVDNTVPTNPGAPQPAPTKAPAVDEKNDHIRGGKNAKVTLIEYSDFECPFCGRFAPTVKQALDEYGDDIRVVYRHFPLSFHPQAQPAAEASECAAEQGKFWEFHDELFLNQTSLSANYFETLAGELGLNLSKFTDCVKSSKYKSKVQQQFAGGSAAGVGGTPHTFVVGADGNAVTVNGAQPYANLKSAIDSMMN